MKIYTCPEATNNEIKIELNNIDIHLSKSQAKELYKILGESLYNQIPYEVEGFFDFYEEAI